MLDIKNGLIVYPQIISFFIKGLSLNSDISLLFRLIDKYNGTYTIINEI